MKQVLVLALAALSVAGCAKHRGAVEAGRSTPKIDQLAQRYGCPSGTVTQAARSSRTAVAPGTPLCSALGRYGEPISVSSDNVSGMRLVSMLHRPAGRYVSVVYVYYEDTKENRQNRRPIGRWIVQSVRESR